MFCENCGKEIPEDVSFCPHCGFKNGETPNTTNTPVAVGENKNMILALIISFILIGIGILYAGNKKKGIILFVV